MFAFENSHKKDNRAGVLILWYVKGCLCESFKGYAAVHHYIQSTCFITLEGVIRGLQNVYLFNRDTVFEKSLRTTELDTTYQSFCSYFGVK